MCEQPTSADGLLVLPATMRRERAARLAPQCFEMDGCQACGVRTWSVIGWREVRSG